MRASALLLSVFAASFLFPFASFAQDATSPQPLPHVSLHPDSQTDDANPAPAPTPPQQPQPQPAVPQPAPAAPTATLVAAPSAPNGIVNGTGYERGPRGKETYVGPENIITLPPTPMLDEEGKQRLDPDGKPMWNPPVKQQRDKHGHPLFVNGKPVFQTASDLGYDDKGHKLHEKKEKKPKLTPMEIARGTFTVDGVIGKAELNYNIADFKYMYFYVPGVGVTVISNEPFPGASPQKDAFNDTTLTVKVDDHTLQLAGDKHLLGSKPATAYVLVDRDFKLPSAFPVVGYGTLRVAPYQWPGSRPNARLADVVEQPPIPADLRPVMLLDACPKGEMRLPQAAALPGQKAPPDPCIPIARAQALERARAAASLAAAKAALASTTRPPSK